MFINDIEIERDIKLSQIYAEQLRWAESDLIDLLLKDYCIRELNEVIARIIEYKRLLSN